MLVQGPPPGTPSGDCKGTSKPRREGLGLQIRRTICCALRVLQSWVLRPPNAAPGPGELRHAAPGPSSHRGRSPQTPAAPREWIGDAAEPPCCDWPVSLSSRTVIGGRPERLRCDWWVVSCIQREQFVIHFSPDWNFTF